MTSGSPYARSAALYDAFYADKDYGQEAATLAALIRERNPEARTVLDVACGSGRHLAHLRGLGFAVEGLDLDEGLLAVARCRLPGVTLTQGSMDRFDLGRRFDAVTCLFSAIGYMRTEERLRAAVARMASHVGPGGVLVVEPWILPDAWQQGMTSVEAVEDGPRRLVRVGASRRDGNQTVVRFHYAIAEDGEITTFDERHELGLFAKAEYLDAVEAAGLTARWIEPGLSGRGLVVAVRAGA